METQNTQTTFAESELQAVVRAAQAGSREAFDELVARFERTVIATAMRVTGNYVDAEDVCQDVFIKVYLCLDTLQEPAAFAGWIRRIARNQAINRCKRHGRELPTDTSDFAARAGDGPSPYDTLQEDETRSQVQAGLEDLRPIDRDALVGYYFQDRSVRELAGDFDIPEGTVKRRLHTARHRLGDALTDLAPV
jgi:RNA polymerase sigma-70 factor, ECF subfamily